MTLDGFLTFFTLIVAAYGIVSTDIRLRLRLRLLPLSIVSLIAFAAIVYFEVFTTIGRPCTDVTQVDCNILFVATNTRPSAAQDAFFVVIFWFLIAGIIITRQNLFPSSLPTLRRLVDELSYQDKFAELIQVSTPHLELLDDVAARQFALGRLYDWFKSKKPISISSVEKARWRLEGLGDLPKPSQWENFRLGWGHFLARLGLFLRDGKKEQEAAKEIIETLMLTPALVDFISVYRADFGVKLLRMKASAVHEFSNTYFTALISTPRSTLYSEIRSNENFSSAHTYYIPEKNKLLYFLFMPATNAEKLGVWKPLGEWLLSKLRPTLNQDYIRLLNFSAEEFDEMSDPSFVVIRFFDVMVSAAEYEGVNWHMWLFYYRYFLERLIAIYDDHGPDVDRESENPTRAAALISEMFYAMARWIRAINELPGDSPHLTMNKPSLDNENGNIPKSAILAFGSCLALLFSADNIGWSFKTSMHERAANLIDDLPQSGPRAEFRSVLISSIINGGPRFGMLEGYKGQLRVAYDAIDHVVRERLDDYKAALYSS